MDAAALFAEHRRELREAAERGGGAGAVEYIRRFSDPAEARTLSLMARRELVMRDPTDDLLAAAAVVARAGIDEVRDAADRAGADERRALLDLANVMSYNLAADLAPCWPGDDLDRHATQFEDGRRAAADCVRWRTELGKGPGALAGAWWVQGVHELALGKVDDARSSFAAALSNARAARDPDDEGFDFLTALAEGFLGLAEMRSPAGSRRYDTATRMLRVAGEHEGKTGEDARFAAAQVETMRAFLDDGS